MKSVLLNMPKDYSSFSNVSEEIYKDNIFYRGTGTSIVKLLLSGKSSFLKHARVFAFLVTDLNNTVGRFALIHDRELPEYVQVAFFEARPGLSNILGLIKNEIKNHLPGIPKIVVGLNGHLNYGAGILISNFNEAPIFGLPYNPDYYADYFMELTEKRMYTFKYSIPDFLEWAEEYKSRNNMPGLKIRLMNKKKLREEVKIYTDLNNLSFQDHPYWADRYTDEDLELFYPFRHLLDNENLIIAEVHGKAVGFLLWYPDFNSLKKSGTDLNLIDVIKFRSKNRIDSFRYTEVGILPEYRRSPVIIAMQCKVADLISNATYKTYEAGFIFEENRHSIALAKRMLKRLSGDTPGPYRQFAVYEGTL